MQATGELVAGRELDALVAEKVMGWHRRSLREVIAIYAKSGPWADTPDNHWYDANNILVADANETFDDDGRETLPWSPSTDIAAAWAVVEHLRGQGRDMNLYWEAARSIWIVESWIVETTGANAETAPLAICRAALRAVSQAE